MSAEGQLPRRLRAWLDERTGLSALGAVARKKTVPLHRHTAWYYLGGMTLFLFAVRDPEPHPRLLDRFLVMAESRGLPSIIGVNKMDLDEPTAGNSSLAHDIFRPYRGLYPVYFLSARTGYGLDQLTEALQGKITAVAGPSGSRTTCSGICPGSRCGIAAAHSSDAARIRNGRFIVPPAVGL